MTTPTPKTHKTMNFVQVLAAVITGAKATKLDWNNPQVYMVLRQGFLQIYRDDRRFYNLILSEADLIGEDWVLLDSSAIL